MTNEQLLSDYRDDSKFPYLSEVVYTVEDVAQMMDAAREDEVVKFEKWRIDNGYNIRNNGKYAIYYMGQGNHTLNELYKLYKNR